MPRDQGSGVQADPYLSAPWVAQDGVPIPGIRGMEIMF